MEKVEYERMVNPYLKSYNPYKNWRKALEITKQTLEDIYSKWEDRKVTLRYLYYRLVKRKIMGLVKSQYDGFIKSMTRARKDFYNSEWSIFQKIVDDTRDSRGEFFYKDELGEIEDRIKNAFTLNHHLDPWVDDPLVEIWVEKASVFQMYQPIAKKYRLYMQNLRGNIIFNIIRNAFVRFYNTWKMGRRIIILYIGDFNPAGDKRPSNILSSLHDLGLKNVEVYKVLITKNQIEEYNLVPSINMMDLNKAQNDPLKGWFVEKHGKLYDVDVEAMEIEDVDRLLTESINKFLDPSKLEKLQEVEEIDIDVIKLRENEFRLTLN